MLARSTNTPITHYAGMTMREIAQWTEATVAALEMSTPPPPGRGRSRR